MPTKPKHMTSEMSIGRQTSRPSLRPWQVVLKWHECPDGSMVSHDYRWKVLADTLGHGDYWLVGLYPDSETWDGKPQHDYHRPLKSQKAAMIQAQDYSDGFRRHVWESIHGPWKPTAR